MKHKSIGPRVGVALAFIALSCAMLIGVNSGASSLLQPQTAKASTGGSSGSSANPQRPETLVVHVPFHSTAERDQLATQWDAAEADTSKGYLTFYVDRPTYNQMLAAHLTVQIDQQTTDIVNNPNLFGPSNPNTFFGGYRTVEDMQTFLDQEVAAYPNLAEKIDIGDSWCKVNAGQCVHPNSNNGYDLWVLHITNRSIPGPKPVYWFEAGIHAREIAVPEVAMFYIDYLLSNYATNADAHWLVDYQDIWIMPMVNPDGHHIVESGGGGNSPYYQRKNGNFSNGCTTWPPSVSTQYGTDNNRNFTFQWGAHGGSSGSPCTQTYRGPSAASDPETQAVMAKISSLIPDQNGSGNTEGTVGTAPFTTTGVYQSMHSNAALNLYAWGGVTSHAPNYTQLANIGQHMSAANASPSGNGYLSEQSINLYATDGTTVDWGYGTLGIPSYTTEVDGNDFLVPYNYTTGTIWPDNRGQLLYLSKIARTPYQQTYGPDTSNVTATPMTVTQGTPSALAATINYAWTGNSLAQNVGAAEYYVDTPWWNGGTAIPMSLGGSGQTVSATASVDTTSLAPGRHIIFVRGRGVNNIPTTNLQSWGPVTAVFLDVLPNGGPTPTPTNTPTPANTATNTPVPPTNTPTRTNTPAPPTNTPTRTNTPGGPTATATPTTQATNTPIAPTATSTPAVPTPTATQCASTGLATSPRIVGKGKPAANPGHPSGSTLKLHGSSHGHAQPAAQPLTQLVLDPSFELGTPNPDWTEASTNFGTPLCDATSCGTGGGTAGPNTGNWWAWFGGTPNAEDGSVSQAVTIPAGTATLQFYLWIGAHSGNGAADYIHAMIDNTAVFTATDADTAYDSGYVAVQVDISAYADGGSHTLAMVEHNDASGTGININVDDVTINSTPGSPCPTATATSVATATATSVPATSTPAATNTPGGPTDTPAPSNTPGGPTDTPVPTNTPGGPTNTPAPPTVTPTDCPNPFVDITGNVFYGAIHYLNCRGVINGVDATHYGPGGTSTRGQFAKVVVLGFGIPLSTPATPSFTDVPTTYFAYVYIESGFANGVLNGYDAATCASIGAAFPCYGPNRAITRGQLTKLVVNAGHYALYTPTTPDFTDVPASNVFYVSIETAFHNSVVGGYPDHTFRPNNNIRRDEMAQIVFEGIVHMP